MGFIFLSYTHGDRVEARRLVEALRARGITVWWDVDRRSEPGDWSSEVDDRLDDSTRVVALVTRNVVESQRDFVFAEMYSARDLNKLIPLQIGDFRLPYKFLSIMLSLNRRAYRSFDQVLEAEALDDISAACGIGGAADARPGPADTNPLRGNVALDGASLAIATAVLEELPVATIVDAAVDLESRLKTQSGTDQGQHTSMFRARSDRLRDIGAVSYEQMHPRLGVTVHCARFADPEQRFAVLEYAWDELDGLRESLLAWLDAMAVSPNPDVRASIGIVIGALARKRFATVLDQLLARWMLGPTQALRDVADLAFRVATDAPGIEQAVETQIRDWARSKTLPSVRAAIELACGYTGSRLPSVAIETLKIVAKSDVANLDVVALMHDAIEYLANANREAADGSLFDLSKLLTGLCEWVGEAVPDKEHKMLPLVLFLELMRRLPMRAPKHVPGVLSVEAVMADPEMARSVAQIFNVALRTGGGQPSARDLSRACLKQLCRRAESLAERGMLAHDPVLALVRETYAASPTERDRDRLAYAVAGRYARATIEAMASDPQRAEAIVDAIDVSDAVSISIPRGET